MMAYVALGVSLLALLASCVMLRRILREERHVVMLLRCLCAERQQLQRDARRVCDRMGVGRN